MRLDRHPSRVNVSVMVRAIILTRVIVRGKVLVRVRRRLMMAGGEVGSAITTIDKAQA